MSACAPRTTPGTVQPTRSSQLRAVLPVSPKGGRGGRTYGLLATNGSRLTRDGASPRKDGDVRRLQRVMRLHPIPPVGTANSACPASVAWSIGRRRPRYASAIQSEGTDPAKGSGEYGSRRVDQIRLTINSRASRARARGAITGLPSVRGVFTPRRQRALDCKQRSGLWLLPSTRTNVKTYSIPPADSALAKRSLKTSARGLFG